MPIQPPILEDQASLNAWLDQSTEELNIVQDDVEELRGSLEALEVEDTAILARLTGNSILTGNNTTFISELRTALAASTDFADFQTRVAALT